MDAKLPPIEMDEMSDLLRRCKAAPKAEEMNALLSAIHPHLILALRVYCGNDSSIDDFAQEAMQRIVERIQTSRASSFAEFRAWCVTIASRIATDHHRKGWAKRVSVLDPVEIEKLRDAGVEPEAGLSHDASRALSTLKSLGETCRELLTLHFLHGLDYSEISEAVGKSYDAVRMAIERCRKEAQSLFERSE